MLRVDRPSAERGRHAGLVGLLLLTAVTLIGCRTARSDRFPPSVAAPGQPTHTIYVTANHWHSGVVLPDAALLPQLDAALQPWRDELERRGQPDPAWHEFGWGDDAYYKSDEQTKTSGLTLAALLWPTTSVNHVWALPTDPPTFFDGWNVALFRVELSEAGYQKLTDFLLRHLALDDRGEPIAFVEQPGIYGDDSAFLTANPRRKYIVLHNCNHMVADALAQAGLPISAIYAIHSVNVEYQLDRAAEKYDEVTRLQSRADELEGEHQAQAESE
ncbi:MAG: DUF2459 domain-containing protein [Planctomycetota bacterium]